MKIIQQNKKAFFDYEIVEKYVAGLVLTGAEIKSVREGHVTLKGAYITLVQGEAFLKKAQISRYKPDGRPDYNPFRERKLLLNKIEIDKLEKALSGEAVTIVPLALGLEGKYAKLEIAVCKGKKKWDKRESIKKREAKRTMDRIVKRGR